MKPKKITVFLIFFLTLLAIKTYGQSKIQKDSTKIVEAFNRTQTVDIGSEIVDSLKNIIASLTGKIKNIEESNLTSKREEYLSKYKVIKAQLNLLKALKRTTNRIMGDRNDMKSKANENLVNNPTTNTLGFTFVDIVIKNLGNVLTEYLDDSANKNNRAIQKFKKKKKTFLNRIQSIVSIIAPIFPPLEIVNRITDKLENHVESVISWENNHPSPNAKKLIIENEPVFKPIIIKKFTDSLKLFITFYQKLSNTNKSFLSDIETHEIKYNAIITKANKVIAFIEKDSDIDFKNIASIDDQVDALFEKGASKKNISFYKRIVQKESVKIILSKLQRTIDLVGYLNDFHSDYQIIVLKNYDNYLGSLQAALLLPGAKVKEIEKMRKIAIETRDGVKGDNTKIGFVKKYSEDLSDVNNHMEAIEKEIHRYQVK